MLVQPVRHLVSMLLREPEIPGARLLDSSTDVWAINRAAALDNFPINGLKVYVPAWSSMGKGDKVELQFDDQVVNQHIITDDAEVGQRVTLWVEPRHWLTGTHTLAYRVTRFNQGAETFTPALKLYAKLEIPAGQDLNPEEGSHSNLYLFIDPAIVEDIVDKEIAAAGVDIIIRAESGTGEPYPDAAVGDVMVLSWGGVLVESAPLTAEQISDPATHPIVIHVDEATILAAGDTDISGLAVTFRVRDVVHNFSEDWCKATRLVVMTGTDLRDAPIVKEATNNILDLDALEDKNITAQVWAKGPAFKLEDRIILKMRGTTVDNEAVEVNTPAQTVNNLPHTYEFELSNADVRQLAKTQVTFSYRVERPGVTDPLPSKGQFVTFIGEPKHLAAPKAEDEQNGAIDPDLPHPRVRIPFDPIMQQGMAIELIWFGTRPDSSSYTPELDWYFPSRDEIEAENDFFITVESQHLKTLEGGTLELWYHLLSEGQNGDQVRRESLHAALLQVGEPQLELVKPIVLGEQDGALEPGDLPGGIGKLTAPRPTVKPTQSGDIVTYTWTGEVTGTTEDSVTLNGLSKDKDVNFTLNATFVAEHIEPNRGKKVTVSYRIWRAATNETSYSNVLEFGVGQAIGSGNLKVMGARFNCHTFGHTGASRVLSAFDATTEQPIEAQWKYATDTEWTTATTWTDTTPQEPLQVRSSDKQITLNPVNIIGNGHSFVAHRDGGDVIAWGNADSGGKIPPAIMPLKDIVEVSSTNSAYAARRTHGAVVVWGAANNGGNMGSVVPSDFVRVVGNMAAFAGLKNANQVVAWGHDNAGSTVPTAIAALRDIVRIVVSGNAFAAQRATGQVVTWGNPNQGGNLPTDIALLTDINMILGAQQAFAALRANGRLVAWGNVEVGGDLPEPIAALNDIIELRCNTWAFIAKRATGQWVAWGLQSSGGTISPEFAELKDIVDVCSTAFAFAARRANGHVVAWGHPQSGGKVPADIALLNDIVQVAGTGEAFAALRKNGTVVAWGKPGMGGIRQRLRTN
ncbi:hypothetical protein [Pseudomonas sp. B14-6]|uniref:RCC1 domain-containing protein n=1 Tax=Pseudomonas sp. B14-6 TaxID=2738843 RepID=UPI00211595BB|nr:hypothetical protein [Pseudomonas sp. B14-6]